MAADPASGRSDPSRVLRVVFGSTFLIRFAFGLTLSSFAAYLSGSSVGISSSAIGPVGLVGALAPIGEFSTVLLTGGLADRRGRFPVLIGSMASAGLLLLLIALSRSPLWLGGLNLLFGIASGAILTSSLALVGDEAAATERGHEMGRFDAVNLLGWVLGFAVGFGLLGILPNTELARLFDAGAAILALGSLLAYLMLRGITEPAARPPGVGFAELLRTALRREVVLVTLPWLVIYLLIGTLFVFLGAAATGIGIAPTDLAIAIGVGGLLLLATQPYFGGLADRHGRTRMLLIGTLGFVGVLVGGGLLATYGESLVGIGVLAVSVLPALAYGPAALAALADVSRNVSRATTMSVYTLSISLGMFLGLLLSSSLFSRFGALGLDLYFAAIALGLVALTAIRYADERAGRVPRGRQPPTATTPVR